MVDSAAARRTQDWVDEAVALGGKVLLGGQADGNYFQPTILTDVPVHAKVCSNEAFGVMINDIPTYRIDHMPYGGVKDSGQGREGLRWAIEDMTEIRIMVLAWPQ